MRELQTAHEAAAIAAHAHGAGAGILPTRHPAKLNGQGRRSDGHYTPQLKLDKSDVALTVPQPPPRPRPVRGRRATDRRPTAFPHPSQLKAQTPFMAQLMSQDQRPAVAAVHAEIPPAASLVSAAKPPVKLTQADLVSAQRRHFEQVGAYRRTLSMATDFIIRRYHLAADFQGVMISDTRAVEMLV